MEKKDYFAPEVKFHQLRGNAIMQEASTEIPVDPEDDPEAGAKGGMFFFDEDED